MLFGSQEVAWFRTRTAWAMRLGLVVGVLVLGAFAGAASSQARSTKNTGNTVFRAGDVFFTDTAGVQEFSPAGELRQTIPGTTGAGALCFTPSGSRLVLPGVGLLNRAGRLVASRWAAAPDGRCAIDTAGDVYVRSGPDEIAEYNVSGHLEQTFQVAGGPGYLGLAPYYLALAPDQCTIYYGAFNALTGRFDVCTDTQESPLSLDTGLVDDLQFRPNGDIIATGDPVGFLYGSTGASQTYIVDFAAGDDFRSVSLDPDGTSFWDCCNERIGGAGQPFEIFRFDIATGQIITSWPAPSPYPPHGMAVYSPQGLG